MTASSEPLPTLAALVGVGMRTPLGLNTLQTSMLLRAGFAAMAEAPLGDDGEAITMCHQSALDPQLHGPPRLQALALPALAEMLGALKPLAASTGLRSKLLVSLDPAEQLGKDDAVQLSQALYAACDRQHPGCTLEVSQRGEAAVCFQLPGALKDLHAGRVDVVILGGVHSDHHPARIAQLAAQQRLYSNDNMDAVLPGEAAAFVALVSDETARRQALPVLARLCGVGQALEEARWDNDLPAAPAKAATAAMRAASKPLEERGLRAGWVVSDLAFEAWRLREWQTLFLRANNVLGPPYWLDSPAQRLGALGAAAGPLCMGLVAQACRSHHAAADLNLCFLGSDGGERGAMLLAAP